MVKISKKQPQTFPKKQSKQKDRRAKCLANYLFRCFKFLSAALRKSLISHGLLSATSVKKDSQECLRIIWKKRNLPNFLACNGKSKSSVNTMIKNTIRGRNCVCHNNLPEISSKWNLFLDSWIDTARLINDSTVEAKLKGVRRLLKRTRQVPIRPKSDVSSLTIFRKLESEKQTSKWTRTKQKAAVYLGDKVYDIIMDEYSPALDDFLTSRKLQSQTSIIDCYAQTNLVFANCSSADFKSPHDGTPFDMTHLQIAVDGRHDAVHEQNPGTILNWDRCLASMIYVSKGIGANQDAIRIAKVRSELIGARNRTMREMKFPRIRVKSNFIKGKPHRINTSRPKRLLKSRLGRRKL